MRRIGLTISVLGLLVASGAGCERIPQICEDSCKQQARCDPNFSDYGYAIRDCRSDCEDYLEDQVRDVEADCKEAILDYRECETTLSCTNLLDHDYSACDQESLRMSQRCEAQW